MPDYSWKPIEDLPEAWEDLISEDLSGLADIWKDQKEKLRGSEALNRFTLQLQRQWAIETGIIEGLYTMDRGVTRLLIERGIEASLIPHGKVNKPVGEILPIIKDQESVIEGLFDFVGQENRPLTTSYMKQVHQALTAHQEFCEAIDQFGKTMSVPLVRGDWKRQANSPTTPDGGIHQYCPPEQVSAEIDRLLVMHESHSATGVPPELESAWLHHRFTQIHPFQDGNGRVARALASLVFLRAGWFPLVIVSDEHREEYIDALEKADFGDLRRLVSLFARLQKQAIIRALSISEDALSQRETLDAAIAAAAARLRGRVEHKSPEREQVFEISRTLERKAHDLLSSVGDDIRMEIVGIDDTFRVETDLSNAEDRNHWFWNQVVETAKTFHYFADLRTYHAWVVLKIRLVQERQTNIIVSFHSLGTTFLGVMAVSAFVEHRGWEEGGSPSLDGPYPATSEVFQFSYKQNIEATSARFEQWLQRAIVSGLDHWRRQL